MFALRRDLAEQELFAGTTELRLNPSVVQVDLWEFETALAAGDVDRASDIYAGPFLDGIYIKEAPEVERWIEERRAELSKKAAKAFAMAGAAADARGDHERSVQVWKRATTFDPTSATATLGLMNALAAAGDAPGALAWFRIHCSILKEDHATVCVCARFDGRAGEVKAPGQRKLPLA